MNFFEQQQGRLGSFVSATRISIPVDSISANSLSGGSISGGSISAQFQNGSEIVWGVTPPKINKVIHNKPATIVFWEDGTKTIVKAQDEDYDAEKGIAMAYVKKIHQNKGSYFNDIKKWRE